MGMWSMGGYGRNRRKFQWLSPIVSSMPTISWSDDCQVDEYSQRMIETLVTEERAATSELAENSNLGNTDSGRRKVRYRLDEHLIPGGLVKEIQSADRERVFAQTDAALDFLAAHADKIRESKTLDSVDETAKSALEIARDASETVDERVSSIAGKVGSTTQKVENLHDHADRNSENIRNLLNRLYEFQDSISDLSSRIDEVNNTQQELQSAIEEVRTSVDEVEEPDSIDQQLEPIEDMTETLRHTLATAMDDIEQLETNQRSLEMEIESARSNRRDLVSQIESIQRQNKKAGKERNKLSEKYERLNERVESLENQSLIDIGLRGN